MKNFGSYNNCDLNKICLQNEANVKAEPSGSGVPQMAKSVSAPAPGTPSSQFAQNVTPDEARTIIANVLYNLLSVHEDDRYIAEIFKRVPSATSYPIYYDVIKNPIDMWMIFKKLKAGLLRYIRRHFFVYSHDNLTFVSTGFPI